MVCFRNKYAQEARGKFCFFVQMLNFFQYKDQLAI